MRGLLLCFDLRGMDVEVRVGWMNLKSGKWFWGRGLWAGEGKGGGKCLMKKWIHIDSRFSLSCVAV